MYSLILTLFCLLTVSTGLTVSITTTGSSEIGLRYSLTCTAVVLGGERVTRIAWYKDNCEIITSTSPPSLTYSILSLVNGDSGKYTCRVQVRTLVKISTHVLDIPSGQSNSCIQKKNSLTRRYEFFDCKFVLYYHAVSGNQCEYLDTNNINAIST